VAINRPFFSLGECGNERETVVPSNS